MRFLGLLFLGLAALLGVTFALLNARPVLFDYYLGSMEVPLSILLVSSLIIGILLGMAALFPSLFKLKLENRRLRRNAR